MGRGGARSWRPLSQDRAACSRMRAHRRSGVNCSAASISRRRKRATPVSTRCAQPARPCAWSGGRGGWRRARCPVSPPPCGRRCGTRAARRDAGASRPEDRAYHCARALFFWNRRNRHASWTIVRRTRAFRALPHPDPNLDRVPSDPALGWSGHLPGGAIGLRPPAPASRRGPAGEPAPRLRGGRIIAETRTTYTSHLQTL